MSRLLFVVHRYAPYPGGSEYYVQDMAEECLKRGHDVTVLAQDHLGDLNGIKVTNDYNVLIDKWDLIIVHGADCFSQNMAHINAELINKVNPVLYLLIKPSNSHVAMLGLQNHKYIGCSTNDDHKFITSHGFESKIRTVIHGVNPTTTIKTKTKDPGKFVAVSAGGFWPHKCMSELATAWIDGMPKMADIQLHLYGYGMLENAPPDSPNVFIHKGCSKDEVLQAIANADIYIMNSSEEGFGLVLLEAMMNKTPWFAKNIAAAKDFGDKYGTIYTDEKDLIHKIRNYKTDQAKINNAYEFVINTYSITDTVMDIENVLLESLSVG